MKKGRPVHVIGAGGHAKVVISALRACGFHPRAAFDDQPLLRGRSLLGVLVNGPIEEIGACGDVPAVLAIGDNRVRRTLASRWDLEWLTVVHPSAVVDGSAEIGPGTVVLAQAVVQAEAVVGAHAILNTASVVEHDCRLGDFVHVAPRACLCGEVRLHEGVLCGAGSVLLPRVHIGAWTVIGAGAVVLGNLPPKATAAGVPARVLKGRSR